MAHPTADDKLIKQSFNHVRNFHRVGNFLTIFLLLQKQLQWLVLAQLKREKFLPKLGGDLQSLL